MAVGHTHRNISNLVFIFQALALQLHFANQARHRTCGPFSFKKGTAAVAFREFGNECGVVSVNLILLMLPESRFSGPMQVIYAFYMADSKGYRLCGGERGIRTLDRVSPIHAFQACAFNHSAISPRGLTALV